MAQDYVAKLFEMMQEEYDRFISDLTQAEPSYILNRAYEKVFKEELMYAAKEKDFSNEEAKALCKTKCPLDYIYQEWIRNDYSYSDILRDTIDDSVGSAIKRMMERKCRNNER